MEFGKIANLADVDWHLPPEDPQTECFLRALPHATAPTKIFLGAPAWGCKDWVGRIYPPQTRPADFLFNYSRNFNCIELNTTHYGIPSANTVRGWCAQVPLNFLFCPKVPQAISHRPGGLSDLQSLRLWWECLTEFGIHLGPCFLQLPPHFDYSRKAELFRFLQSWPDQFPLALELRHTSWFEKLSVRQQLVEYLRSRGIGLVILDVAGRRDLLHASISAEFVLLRFIGNGLHPTDFTRAHDWVKRITTWSEYKLPKLFFMVHEPEDLKTPEMADWLVREFNHKLSAELTPLARPLLLG